jgi:DNA-binding transcriptional regulator YhcF (GntR family)
MSAAELEPERELSDRDAAVLSCAIEHIRLHGCAPSRRELAASLAIAQRSVMRAFARLQARGYIEPPNRRARSLVVLRDIDGSPFSHNSARIQELEDLVRALRAQLEAHQQPRCAPHTSRALSPESGARCETTHRCRRRR